MAAAFFPDTFDKNGPQHFYPKRGAATLGSRRAASVPRPPGANRPPN
jgi:hypothetical protein